MTTEEKPASKPLEPIPVKVFIPTALGMAIIGWGGLIYLIFFTLPTLGPRWLFFFLLVLALTGSFMPLTAFLNVRFVSKPPASISVIVREALMVGIYFPTLAWLQIGRVLNPGLAIILAIGLITLEWALRLRDRSRWNPDV